MAAASYLKAAFWPSVFLAVLFLALNWALVQGMEPGAPSLIYALPILFSPVIAVVGGVTAAFFLHRAAAQTRGRISTSQGRGAGLTTAVMAAVLSACLVAVVAPLGGFPRLKAEETDFGIELLPLVTTILIVSAAWYIIPAVV